MKRGGEGRCLVKDLGELELVERITRSLRMESSVVKGPGDDCAVVELDDLNYSLLKTDSLVEGIHFRVGTDPVLVGRKALARTLSDIAAMGGEPRHALVTLVVSRDREVAELEKWYQGMESLAREFSVSIVGGETADLGHAGAVISVALTGRVRKEHCAFRGNAGEGVHIAVTGKLGGSFASERHLLFQPRIKEAEWLCRQAFRPSSMMDLSDGLATDLPRLLAGTELGYEVKRESIPVNEDADLESAIGEGEDYELLMTFPEEAVDELNLEWRKRFPQTPLTVIGSVTRETVRPLEGGWEHFSG